MNTSTPRAFAAAFLCFLLLATSASAADAKNTFAFEGAAYPDLARRAETISRKVPDASTPAEVAAFLNDVRANKALQPKQPARWMDGNKGKVVGIYVIYFKGEAAPSVGWTEEVRDSLFAGGLKTVLQLASKVSGAADVAPETEYVMSREAHILKEDRGTITIDVPTEKVRNTASLTDALPDYVVVVDLVTGQQPKKHAAQEFVLLTGEREAFFWTADLPVNHVKQLKLDDKGVIQSQEEAPSFYVGINYTFGDAASTPTRFWDALAIKGLIKASKQPLDSYGVALAVRGGYFSGSPLAKLGLDLSAFSPFAGVTFTREDKEAKDGVVTKTGRKAEFRAGIGFDIGTALKWIKKPAAGKPAAAGETPAAPAAPAAPGPVVPGATEGEIPNPPGQQ